jgi:hypothetical protein
MYQGMGYTVADIFEETVDRWTMKQALVQNDIALSFEVVDEGGFWCGSYRGWVGTAVLSWVVRLQCRIFAVARQLRTRFGRNASDAMIPCTAIW